MLGYRLFLLVEKFVMRLSPTTRQRLFASLAWLAHRLAFSRNTIIQKNLSFALSDTLTTATKKEVEAYCYRNLALNLLQVMENRFNTAEDLARKVTFENREKVDTYLAHNRPIIFISAHFGNWELGATALAALITPTTAIYKKLANEHFNPYLVEARERHRLTLVDKNGALKHLTRALKQGQCVSLMIDQASNAASGISVDFFAHPTYHTAAAAQLSKKYNAPIVPLYILTKDEQHYTIRFEEPIDVIEDEDIHPATQTQATQLETIIRANPKFWFWCHKRWKGEHPQMYRT